MERSSRQKVGIACEECRRRKSKCDGEQPCGLCLEFRVECVFEENRSKRGPKKGQVDALKARIAMLELQLSNQSRVDHVNVINADTTAGPPIDATDWAIHLDIPQPAWNEPLGNALETVVQAGLQNDGIQPQLQQTLIQPREIAIDPLQHAKAINETLDSTGLSHLMKVDLDQLYFDRVHPLIPMVHRGHYLAWSRLDDVSMSRKCLQWSMRALAASMSSQFRSRSDEFYIKAKRSAEGLEAGDLVLPWLNTDTRIEQAQTWLLLAHYELLDPPKYSPSASIQQALRLAHALRLHCTDSENVPSDIPSYGSKTVKSAQSVFASVEERRRTFWVAFCLDRFLGGYEGSPATIQDEIISVRLPCPEWNFQTSTEVRMGSANDVLNGASLSPASAFAKLVIGMSIFEQCVLHKQMGTKNQISHNESLDFWARHEWLAAAIDKQFALLLPESTDLDDGPLRLITSMVMYGSVVTLSSAINVIHLGMHSQQPVARYYAKTAYKAAISMADLSESMTESTCFKTHIYLPMFLSKAFLYLVAHPGPDQQPAKARLIAWMESLREIHGQARQCIDGIKLWEAVDDMETATMDLMAGQTE